MKSTFSLKSVCRLAKNLTTLACGAFLFTGCAVITIRNIDGDKRTTATGFVPAWPWQDSQQIIDRLNVSARTNAFNLSLRASESEVTNTNLVSAVVGAAVGAAVKAVK